MKVGRILKGVYKYHLLMNAFPDNIISNSEPYTM